MPDDNPHMVAPALRGRRNLPKQASADAGEDNITGFIFGWVNDTHWFYPFLIKERNGCIYPNKKYHLEYL